MKAPLMLFALVGFALASDKLPPDKAEVQHAPAHPNDLPDREPAELPADLPSDLPATLPDELDPELEEPPLQPVCPYTPRTMPTCAAGMQRAMTALIQVENVTLRHHTAPVRTANLEDCIQQCENTHCQGFHIYPNPTGALLCVTAPAYQDVIFLKGRNDLVEQYYVSVTSTYEPFQAFESKLEADDYWARKLQIWTKKHRQNNKKSTKNPVKSPATVPANATHPMELSTEKDVFLNTTVANKHHHTTEITESDLTPTSASNASDLTQTDEPMKVTDARHLETIIPSTQTTSLESIGLRTTSVLPVHPSSPLTVPTSPSMPTTQEASAPPSTYERGISGSENFGERTTARTTTTTPNLMLSDEQVNGQEDGPETTAIDWTSTGRMGSTSTNIEVGSTSGAEGVGDQTTRDTTPNAMLTTGSVNGEDTTEIDWKSSGTIGSTSNTIVDRSTSSADRSLSTFESTIDVTNDVSTTDRSSSTLSVPNGSEKDDEESITNDHKSVTSDMSTEQSPDKGGVTSSLETSSEGDLTSEQTIGSTRFPDTTKYNGTTSKSLTTEDLTTEKTIATTHSPDTTQFSGPVKNVGYVKSDVPSGKFALINNNATAIESKVAQPEWPVTKKLFVFVREGCRMEITHSNNSKIFYDPTPNGVRTWVVDGITNAKGVCV